MFRDLINETPFTVSAVSRLYDRKICVYDGFGDYSLSTTLKAIVAPRVSDNEGFFSSIIRLGTYDTKNSRQRANIWDYAERGLDTCPSLLILKCDSVSAETNEHIESLFGTAFDGVEGWAEVKKINDFFCKTFNATCFVNINEKRTVVFTNKIGIREYHYLQCAIPALLPWYFENAPLTDIEMELIKSLREKSSANYIESALKIAEAQDLRRKASEIILTEFTKGGVQDELDSAVRRANELNDSIRSLINTLGDKNVSLRDLNTRIMGLEKRIANGDDGCELVDFLKRSRNVDILDSGDRSTLLFMTKDYLSYWDEDVCESMINNPNSYIYKRSDGSSYSGNIPADDMRMLINAIFIDQELKIKVCATYSYKRNHSFQARSRYMPSQEYKQYLPNPHIYYHACMGNYVEIIAKLLKDGDDVSCVNQCIASCKSLNFSDSIVMNEFMFSMYGLGDFAGRKFIELPDGKVVTTAGAIKWLKEKEGVNKNEQSD